MISCYESNPLWKSLLPHQPCLHPALCHHTPPWVLGIALRVHGILEHREAMEIFNCSIVGYYWTQFGAGSTVVAAHTRETQSWARNEQCRTKEHHQQHRSVTRASQALCMYNEIAWMKQWIRGNLGQTSWRLSPWWQHKHIKSSHTQSRFPVMGRWGEEAYPTQSCCTAEEKSNAEAVWASKATSLVCSSN